LVLFLLIAANPAWAGTENNALDMPVITSGSGKTLGVLEIKETTPGSIVEGQEVTLTLINARVSGVTWEQPDKEGPGDGPGAWIYAPLVNDNENNAIEEIEILDQTEELVRIRISKMQAGGRGSLLVRVTGDGNDLGAVVGQAGDVRIAIASSPDSGFTEGEVTVAKVSGSEPEAGQEPQEPLEQEDLREEMTGYPWDKAGRVILDNFDERMPASLTVNQSTDLLDNWQWRNPLPQGNLLNGVTYGDGTFVAVGDCSTILTSPDGEEWTIKNSGTTYDLQRVTYGNGTFVAVGYNGAILTSPDGEAWNTVNYGANALLQGVTCGNGTFVAVGDGGNCGTILSSTDSEAWNDVGYTSPLSGVTFGNGTFVAVGANGAILTSTDGVNWNQMNSVTNKPLLGVAYGNGAFVAVGDYGTIIQWRMLIVQKSGDNLPTGTDVTLTAISTDINNPVYEYWVKIPRDGSWVSLSCSDDPVCTFTQEVPGTYTIYAYCKEADAPSGAPYISAGPVTVTFTKDKAVCDLTVDGPNGNQTPGGSATFTASATDHGGTPLYQFWVHDNSGWRVAQNYSTDNTFTMDNLKCGSYTIAAYALDRNDVKAGKWDFAYVKAFVINVDSSVSLEAPASVSPGGTVNLTARANCLTGAEYQFWYQPPGGAWHASGDYTSYNGYSFTADTAGTYKVIVYAKDHYAPATDQFAVWDIKTINCQ